MLQIIGLSLVGGLLNAWRGSGLGKPFSARPVICTYFGLIFGVFNYCLNRNLPAAMLTGLAVTVFLLVGLIMGWGKGFAAFHGRYDSNEIEIPWIDKLSKLIIPSVGESIRANRTYGVVWMTLRAVYFYPLFIVLSVINSLTFIDFKPIFNGIDIASLLVGLIVFTMGIIYGMMRFIDESKAVRVAEFTFGCTFTLGIVLTQILHLVKQVS